MNSETYFIDGKHHTLENVKKIILCKSLGKREEVVMSMIDALRDGEIVLDLGCLYGGFARKLKEKFFKSNIIAGDYLEENLKIARAINPDIANIFQKLNAYDLSLPDGSVNTVTFQEVIEHLEGAANAVKEINRVLKMGGSLILSTPTAYYWKHMLQSFRYELIKKYFIKDRPLSDCIYFQDHEWNRHIYCWTPSTLYTLLKVNGFEYVSHKYCQDGKGVLEKLFLKIFPFLSMTIIMKVKKISQAPSKIV